MSGVFVFWCRRIRCVSRYLQIDLDTLEYGYWRDFFTNQVCFISNYNRFESFPKLYLINKENEKRGPFSSPEEVLGELDYLSDPLSYDYNPGVTWRCVFKNGPWFDYEL